MRRCRPFTELSSSGRLSHPLIRRMLLAMAIASAPLLFVDVGAATEMFAATEGGLVFRSSDEGILWMEVGAVSETPVVALRPGVNGESLYLLTRTGTVQQSLDGGIGWSAIGNAGAHNCSDLAVGRNGDLLVLTETGDLIRSLDQGVSWTTESNVGFSNSAALTIGGEGGGTDSLLAATSSGDIACSADGISWSIVGNTGFTPVRDLLWTDATLRALTDAGEHLRSTDQGLSWVASGTLSQVGARALTTTEGGDLRAITREGEVWASPEGSGWTLIGTVNQVFVADLAPEVPEFTSAVSEPDLPATQLSSRVFPNPVTDRTLLSFTGGPSDAEVDISVYDATGARVQRICSGPRHTLSGEVAWSGSGIPQGVYFVRFRVGSLQVAQRAILIR